MLALVMVAMTIAERRYLQAVGWSPIHRTPTEWPSILALGPRGWLLTVSFLIAGVLGAFIGVELGNVAPTWGLRIAAVMFTIMNIMLMLVAFSADSPDATGTSLHGRVHDTAYPLLLLAATVSAVLMATNREVDACWRRLRFTSRVAAALLLCSAAVTNIDTIAQAGRYLLLTVLLGWAHTVARAAARMHGH